MVDSMMLGEESEPPKPLNKVAAWHMHQVMRILVGRVIEYAACRCSHQDWLMRQPLDEIEERQVPDDDQRERCWVERDIRRPARVKRLIRFPAVHAMMSLSMC